MMSRTSFAYRAVALFLVGLVAFYSTSASAISLIRDAEVEDTLRAFSTPILQSANIAPDSVRILIVNDRSVNAFVAGGLNIFFHTGLILNAPKPGMLLGVIAHEVGHIAGAHLSQLSQKSSSANLGAIISYVLGAAAIAAGSGQAGAAVISAGQNVALRDLLSVYRGNEQAADQAAIQYLEANNISAVGMLEMFEVLRRESRQQNSKIDPYLRTHPLTSERIAHIRSHLKRTEHKPLALPREFEERHARMVAKLFAFLEDPKKTFHEYPASDTSIAARLARTVALFRSAQMAQALTQAKSLTDDYPNDPFLHDLRGQIAFEYGRLPEAIQSYERAHTLLPESALILSDLGKSYLATEDDRYLGKAEEMLSKSVGLDDSHAASWRQLAIAQGKNEKIGESFVSLAQEASLRNDTEEMKRLAERALKELPEFSPAHLQANDLIVEAKRREKEKKDNNSLF